MSAVDLWILDLLNETLREVDSALESFEFAKATELLYHFAWDDLCDWYVELSKAALAEDGKAANVTRRVLGEVLDLLLRALHPFMPFITEELWTTLTSGESLVIAPWPKSEKREGDALAKRKVEDLKVLVTEIRRFRNDQGVKNSARVVARIAGLGERDLDSFEDSLRFLVRLDRPTDSFTTSGRIEVASFAVEFDLTGSVDVAAERARLLKDLATIEKDLATAKVKLENENFMAKAPLSVVDEIRARHDHCISEIERINSQLAALATT